MKLPKVDLKELKKFKEENFKERLKFLDQYAAWMKKKNKLQFYKITYKDQ